MTFFRSEEHLRNWAQFDPATEEGIIPLNDLIKLFSGRTFRRRLDPDYFSHMHELCEEKTLLPLSSEWGLGVGRKEKRVRSNLWLLVRLFEAPSLFFS